MTRLDNSFGAIIEQLKRKNVRLSQQLSELISQKKAELERRLALEEENGILHSMQQPLEEQVRHHASIAEHYKGVVSRCFSGLFPVLEDLRKGTLLEVSGGDEAMETNRQYYDYENA